MSARGSAACAARTACSPRSGGTPGGLLRQGDGPVARYRFIEAEKATYPVRRMCGVLGVRRELLRLAQVEALALQDERLTERIKEIHEGSRGTYAAPPIHAEARRAGHRRRQEPGRTPDVRRTTCADPP